MSLGAFSLVKDFLLIDLFGNAFLFVAALLLIIIILLLVTRVSLKVGLILIFPAILAIFGAGVNDSLIGVGSRWIAVLAIVFLAIGAYAFIWFKLSD